MMSKTKHTPGPWHVDDGDSDALGVFGLDAAAICYLSENPSVGLGLRGRDEDTANANLMAAAPLFLSACAGTDPDDSALYWLSALLTELRETDAPNQSEDPTAAWTALWESEALLRNLQSAQAQAQGAGLHTAPRSREATGAG
jgi:hypothetical protein